MSVVVDSPSATASAGATAVEMAVDSEIAAAAGDIAEASSKKGEWCNTAESPNVELYSEHLEYSKSRIYGTIGHGGHSYRK